MTTYVLGGGCFWCLDAVFRRLKAVSEVVSGYAGGTTERPSYYDVGSGTTGHAEVVQVTFDEAIIPKETVLDIYFSLHDPTTVNRQGADIGTEYRSIMLYSDTTQKQDFEAALERATMIWDKPLMTEVRPLETFYIAELEHQDYFNKNPEAGYCTVVINPKVTKIRQHFKEWFQPA